MSEGSKNAAAERKSRESPGTSTSKAEQASELTVSLPVAKQLPCE